ncbi:MAG: citramalate synthase [Planctomycetes bacterium]|nr:citramalate synthase [Planctomycetota bacterium]
MSPAKKSDRKGKDDSPAGARIAVYDTTLRDGAQGEHVSFSLEDKLDMAQHLDWLGVDYIEGGWPFSNQKDISFYEEAARLKLENARLAAFGSTRRAKNKASEDDNLIALVNSRAPVVTIFGKTWDLHVTDALRVDLPVNLEMITDSVAFVKAHDHVQEVVYDAEHFFDGFFANRDYAMKTVAAAVDGGADVIVLCDTNGGRLPHEIEEATREVIRRFGSMVCGIHTHNDSGLAVANSVVAVQAGCRHVQGTVNGLGERSGNADLCSVLPNLELKLGLETVGRERLRRLTELSRYVYDTANLMLKDNQPFVGRSAFAHKGGVHVSAVQRNTRTYEHIDPETVGNERRVLVSELSGRSNVVEKTRHLELEKHPEKMKDILNEVQRLENEGYQFEAAEASFELLVRRIVGEFRPFFKLLGFRVTAINRDGSLDATEATVKVQVRNEVELSAAEGNGPVSALDKALRKALVKFYPVLEEMTLANFKVRIVDAQKATDAKVRVIIESRDPETHWTTVGVSANIIEASWIALVDSIEYKLLKGAAVN